MCPLFCTSAKLTFSDKFVDRPADVVVVVPDIGGKRVVALHKVHLWLIDDPRVLETIRCRDGGGEGISCWIVDDLDVRL